MEINKIAASVLLAGVIAMVSGLASQALYTGSLGEHGHHEAKRGFTIAGAEEAGAGEGAAVPADTGPVDIMPLMASADIEAGKAQIKKCTSCHTFDKGGKNGVGPNQWNLVGSHFAHTPGFEYSPALKAAKGTWGFQELSDFLANPKKYIPGNKMSFAGIKNPQDRANLIRYLNTLSDHPLPVPK